MGVGFMAALPISRPKPGFVTLPTPLPPSIWMLLGFLLKDTVEHISAPCVASGSSPPSFIAAQVTLPFSSVFVHAILSVAVLLFGNDTVTCFIGSPLIRAYSAPFVAAVAVVPVV